MRIVVTGASGFIGTRLVKSLANSKDHAIEVVSRRQQEVAGVHVIVVPNLTVEALEKFVPTGTVDVVINLAASGVTPTDRNTTALLEVNAVFPARLVQWAASRGSRAVVTAGSCSEYRGRADTARLSETDELEPEKLYGSTKAAGGLLAVAMGRALNVPVAHIRLFNVYGPGEAPHRLLPSLLAARRAPSGVRLSPGSQCRDFLHVDDAVGALLTVAEFLAAGRMTGGIFNACTGVATTVRQFVETAADFANISRDRLIFGAFPMRPDEIPAVIGNPQKLQHATGWHARIDLATGIRSSVDFSDAQ